MSSGWEIIIIIINSFWGTYSEVKKEGKRVVWHFEYVYITKRHNNKTQKPIQKIVNRILVKFRRKIF